MREIAARQAGLSYLSADGGVEGVSDGLTVALGVGVVFGFDHYAGDGGCRSIEGRPGGCLRVRIESQREHGRLPTINSGGRVSSPDSPDKSPILGLTCKLLKSKCWRHCIECQLRIGPFNKVYLYIGFNEGPLHLIYSLNGTRDGLENHVDVRVA